ncbi:hypothetical protein KNO15_18905 [Leifsonia shinshuensis]|uniref:DUF6069 family protein n=1 Tax=Leifsonia shinshuensis TaxID=150026 RepID=UPI001F50C183|nr:DUF6069 family protein [Leifsonia shinshuensis]MCI0158774.1 hypothetical protein [Leifsonia shinshuensis]
MVQTLKNAPVSRTSGRVGRLLRLATVVAASLAGIVVWSICVPVLGVDLGVGSGSAAQTVGPVSVLVVSLLGGVVAWMLLAVLERLFVRGRLIWQISGWAVLVLSLAGPAGLAQSTGALIGLIAMHLVVGSVLVVGLAWPPRAAARRF